MVIIFHEHKKITSKRIKFIKCCTPQKFKTKQQKQMKQELFKTKNILSIIKRERKIKQTDLRLSL